MNTEQGPSDQESARRFQRWVVDATRERVQFTSVLMIFVFVMAIALEQLATSSDFNKAPGARWMPVQLFACVLCWAQLRWLAIARRHPALIAAIFYSVVSGIGGYYLASLGGFEGPFFYSAYMIAPLIVFLPIQLGTRILLSLSIVGSFVAAYLLPNPGYFSYPLIHIPATYLILGNVVAVALGHWGYRLARDRFFLRELLEHYNLQLSAKVDRKTGEVRALIERLQTTRDAERAELARALHDELGQLIVGARMEISNLERRFKDRSRVDPSQELDFLVEIVEGLDSSSRTLISSLRARDAPKPLRERLGVMIESIQRGGGLKVSLAMDLGDIVLSHEIDEAVFRTAQEALTNTLKHARARSAKVELGITEAKAGGAALLLTVRDDGRGFILGTMTGGQRESEGLGLVGMRERLSALGGQVTTDSSSQGTTIAAHIPLPSLAGA